MKSRARLVISGIVQGVCYRASTSEQAQNIGLTGRARNRPDGTVEVTTEGEKDNIQKLIEWCRIGPPMAEVKDVTVEWQEYKEEFSSFIAH